MENESPASTGVALPRGIRVMFVLPSLGLGGAERQAFLLARHLALDQGAEVNVVTFGENGGIADRCAAHGIPHERFVLRHEGADRRSEQVRDLVRFVAFLRRRRVQILLPYCMFQNVFCGLSWRLGGARVCVWNQRDEGRSRIEPRVERVAVRQFRRFVSNSRHGAQFLVETLGATPDRVSVVHNGVELPAAQASRAEWRRRLGLSDEAFLACMVANLHGYKDHETLVSAWREVVDRLPGVADAHLLLAGRPGNRHEAVSKQVCDLGLAGRVQLLGEVSDVGGLLEAVDLAVFSSYAEGVPNAVLEALAAGLPVVATDYPGIREAVGPAGLEWLVRPRDPRDMADRIVTMALDPTSRSVQGTRGRAWVAEAFGLDRMCRESVNILLTEWSRR